MSTLSSPWSHLSCFLDFILCDFMLTTLLPALFPHGFSSPLRSLMDSPVISAKSLSDQLPRLLPSPSSRSTPTTSCRFPFGRLGILQIQGVYKLSFHSGSFFSTCPRDSFLLELIMPSLHLHMVLTSQHARGVSPPC